MTTTYPHNAFMLFMEGEGYATRPLKAPRDAADPVEAYADSLYAREDDAIVAMGRLTLAETSDFAVVLEPVTIHEDGAISTESAEFERSDVLAAWGIEDRDASATPGA